MAANEIIRVPSVGDAYAAHRFYSLESLYEHQAIAARKIIRQIHSIAGAAYLDSPRRRESQQPAAGLRARPGIESNDFVRAHHTYLIDGRRGSGKTTTLLTLTPFLSALTFGGAGAALGKEATVMRELADLKLRSPSPASPEHRIALVLPVVFTEDMEAQESTMEAVFALMEQELAQREAEDERRKEKIAKLRKTLRGEIGVSWTFARKIGAEALSNDALDYDDFVSKRAALNYKSYTKVISWHRFLDDFLDALGYEVLVLLFDDSDLNPALAEDIVRAMRMYLSHPRAVSIMAVDVEVLTETLVGRNVASIPTLRMLRPQTYALDGKDDRLVRYGVDGLDDHLIKIVELEISNTTALLDKVLPRPNRFRLNLDLMEHVDHFFKRDGLPSENAFAHLCRRNFALDRNFVWWFLDGPYRRLIGENLRELTAFKTSAFDDPSKPIEHIIENRVAFDNFRLLEGSSVAALAARIEEGDRSSEDDPTDDEKRLMDLCVDAQIGSGALEERDTIPGLRRLSDEVNLSSARLQLKEDHARLIGLPRVMRHELLPRNCIYLYQLRRLQPALEEEFPGPSRLVEMLQALVAEGHAQSLRDELASFSRTWPQARNPDLVAFCRGLLRSLTDPRANKQSYTEEGGSDRGALFVILLVAIADDSLGDHRPAAVMSWLESMQADEGLSRLEAMVKALAEALETFERRRQEAIFLWNCANDLALFGSHRYRLVDRQVSPGLVEMATAMTEDKPRFTGLVKSSNEHVSRGPRQGLLLAWSLLPLIEIFEGFGADYLLSDGAARAGWKELVVLFERALQPFQEADPPDEHRAWLFADMDTKTLARIVSDVRGGAQRAKQIDVSRKCAGSLSIKELWRRSSAYRVAAVLGTSQAWVEANLHV